VPTSEQLTPPPASGSGRRWAKFRALSLIAQILLILFAWPFVVLYLLPWERFWAWFRKLPPRTQKVTAAVAVVAFVAMIAIGGIASEREKDRREAAAESEQQVAAIEESASTASTQATAEPTIESTKAPEPTFEAPDPAYAGKLDDDAIADGQGQVEVRGLSATVGPLRHVEARAYDGPRLCSDLTLDNHSSETQWYYVDIELSIQYPSGNEKGVVLVYDNDLGSGNLVPGGHASGQVCFVDRGEVGQHLVLWNRKQASFTTPRRGVWILTV
jgi:hypothetical protein